MQIEEMEMEESRASLKQGRVVEGRVCRFCRFGGICGMWDGVGYVRKCVSGGGLGRWGT